MLTQLIINLLLPNTLHFVDPLKRDRYPKTDPKHPKVKPILLYIPGFDGTLLSPFLQFPELSSHFEIFGLETDPSDRSTFASLKSYVTDWILESERPVYLCGESFGGLLSCSVASSFSHDNHNLKGLILVNPATSYGTSALKEQGAIAANSSNFFSYIANLINLLPLFTDQHSFNQLFQILGGSNVPSIIDTPAKEAYLGRYAFNLWKKLKFMPQSTLIFRLKLLSTPISDATISNIRVKSLIVVAENDNTLDSVSEAARLSNLIPDTKIHVVPGGGHSTTLGSRCDLTALVRSSFSGFEGRKAMKPDAANRENEFYGLVKRDKKEALSPFLYWKFAARIKNFFNSINS
ncbi:hypothetical protein ScalyP_jg501 [Parmales sp. scaly parma]|nr:hypothetical protein ScalyP_jg501 [Parmales sp. scaly parma]